MKIIKACMAFSDTQGNVYDYPGKEAVFRSGRKFIKADITQCIPLPAGSHLFSLPDRYPVYFNRKGGMMPLMKPHDGDEIWAVSAFLPSGYLRTYLPAYIKKQEARALTLWAYTGVVINRGHFYVPGIRIDDDPRSDPEIHKNDDEFTRTVKDISGRYPDNRLVNQLSFCATEYRCLCARNFFLGRYEAPIPTTPSCNADCLGCLSDQDEKSGFSASQHRIKFSPTPEEITQVITLHIQRVPNAVVSFGQGCEGEPLLRGKDIAIAVKSIREKTDRGTIHINTNGSFPDIVELLIRSGVDSIRVSLNSPTERYYSKYYRPNNYTYRDMLKTIERSLNSGIFVSLNLLILPGFTDMETEVQSLFEFLDRFPVNMIQTRNLNIDPDYYLDSIEYIESNSIGINELISELKKRYPKIRLGYYNPPKETF